MRWSAAVALAILLTTSCAGGKPDPAAPHEADTFLATYVSLLNASDESGLAEHLSAHPSAVKDAKVRIAKFGGQGWKVKWTKTSEFEGVWNVRFRGSREPRATPVDVTEVLSRENEKWILAPLPGVVPRPSGAADTTPTGQ
ncbi:hypothetical protein [Streptomyces sp. NPDC058657]|uniref:hypothetical protein n=1 Tax=unclassified Streptomyces TaxID=2593676 RepID=UPI003655665A